VSGVSITNALGRDTAAGIKLAKVPDATYPDRPNRAAAVLEKMLDARLCARLEKVWGNRPEEGRGDCYNVAVSLLRDLCCSGRQKGWRLVEAQVQFNPDRDPLWHVWLEFDGWAVDVSDGDRKPILIMRSQQYREMGRAEIQRIRTARQWLADEE
jgi:hypothetical protein